MSVAEHRRMPLPLMVLEGEVFSELSLSRVNRELALALLRRDDIELALSAPVIGSYLTLPSAAIDRLRARVGITLDRPPDLTLHHGWPPDFRRPAYGRYAHMQPYELGELPRAWVESLRGNADEIWCYGRFVAEMYRRAGFGQETIAIVPPGIDPDVFRPDGPRAQLETRRSFRFLYLGGTIWRKGIDLTLNAFLSAFGPDDDVTLVIKDVGGNSVYRDQNARDVIAPLMRRPDLAEIVYTDTTFDDAMLAALYRSVDVVLAPYRGEGFGMPVLEAMACGTPAIVTAGGATDDFVDDAVGVRVPADRIAIESPDLPDLIGPGWALQIPTERLAEVLRAVAGKRDALAQLGASGAERARRDWTWDRSAAVVAERVRSAASPH